ncbi:MULTISPECIES: TMEM165/GDT1 family protein [unclassified Iodidimonas]|jgi:putative Ca2+/H+ antiporter (TMEM165/GDT1 family)|uniref:TMEM165/GDT1 family protein n=1 Tax=unclassified Iodidimonas TaxID=2626145 RepID=UPI002482819E|nr:MULTISPECIES: TMEM165/GDT1 family protein [unclassified Iodidimonas]
MPLSSLLAIFITVFLAELGDKTQLATVLFASEDGRNPWLVFGAASLALVASTAMAVLLGTYASRTLVDIPLKLIAGIGFIAIGGYSIFEHFKG